MSRYLAPMLSLLWVGIGVVVFLVSWSHLDSFPELVPVHWGLGGQADRYVPRAEIVGHLVVFPCLMVGLVFVGFLLTWLSPKAYTVSIEQPAVGWISSLIFLLFLFIQIVFTLAMAQKLDGQSMEKILFGSIGLFFVGMGPALAWVPRNFFVGIRTPWTLASDEVWHKTHQVGAWSFTTGGVFAIASSLIMSNLIVYFAILMFAALVPVVYSFWLSKSLESHPT